MTYRTLVVVALALIAGTALADGPPHGGHRGPDFDQLAIVLELDDYQKQEVERIMTEHRQAAMERREAHRASGERPDRETMEAMREQMHASLRTQLGTVLTAEQLEKFDALKAMRGDRPPRHHPRHHERRDVERSDGEAN